MRNLEWFKDGFRIMAIPNYYVSSPEEQQTAIEEFASKTGCDIEKITAYQVDNKRARKYKNMVAFYAEIQNCRQEPKNTRYIEKWSIFEWLNY